MRIAVVGSGISGLLSAYLLSRKHEVHLFEAQKRIGGHTHTVQVEDAVGPLPVDTGFIVFNDWTYTNFIKLLAQLKVEAQASDMSFSVRCDRTKLEYNGTSINSLFAQRANLLKPKFYRMIADIIRFNKKSVEDLPKLTGHETIGEYLQAGGYSDIFADKYILPMGSAIWSAPELEIKKFPLKTFVTFFKNHGMLSVENRPQWRVLKGGSKSYLEPISRPFKERMHIDRPVTGVSRVGNGVNLRFADGETNTFDHVVLACHSDESLSLLEDASQAEREILGDIPYNSNETVLHTDTSILPKRKLAWAAWNYLIRKDKKDAFSVTYNMNILQSLKSRETYLVSLNSADILDPEKILRTFTYRHPVYTVASDAARARYGEISGVRNTHYAGAYWRYGFHEDGVLSALNACKYFGETL